MSLPRLSQPTLLMAGIIWLDESWSLRLLLSSLGILGGIALGMARRPTQGENP